MKPALKDIQPASETATLGRNCPGCGCEENSSIDNYSHNEWQIAKCEKCDFVYLKNPPGYAALVDEFSWEKTSIRETKRRLSTRSIGAKVSKASIWRLSLLRFSRTKIAHYFDTGNVLDIGCGAGDRILRSKGVPHGVEISRELNATANSSMERRGGYSIHAPAVDGVKAFPDSYFDSVLMHSFLEHEENPGGLLSGLHRVLKPGGYAYVRVPNYGSLNRMIMGKKWCGFRYPDHVNYFTLASLKAIAQKYGFEFKLLNFMNLIVDDNIKALIIKR